MGRERWKLEIINHQKEVELQSSFISLLKTFCFRALCLLSKQGKYPDCHLAGLEEIEIAFVSEKEMISLHCRFLQDSSSTDVITFPYGEILVNAEMASHYAKSENLSLEQELALYVLHGLLHLAGYNDDSDERRREMKSAETSFLEQFTSLNSS